MGHCGTLPVKRSEPAMTLAHGCRRAIVSVTDSDVANLETALNARALTADARRFAACGRRRGRREA